MLNLRLSPQAVIDLEDIFAFTYKKWGIKQAEKYQDEVYASMMLISENPFLGAAYYYKKGNYRKLNVNRHLIFYNFTKVECLIVRILHERMDLKTNFE